MTNQRDILDRIAEQVAPGSRVDNPGAFEAFLNEKAGEFDLTTSNQQLKEQIVALGGNPNVSGAGIGRAALESENAALQQRLALLQTPLRQGGPSVAEVQQQLGPGLNRFLFPDAPVVQNPTGGGFSALLRDFFTPTVGLPQQDIENLPRPVQPVVRAAQTTASPGGIITSIAGPAVFARPASGVGRGATAARFFADTPGRSLAAEAGANLLSEGAAEAGASLPVQIAAGLAGGVAGAGAVSAAGRATRSGLSTADIAARNTLEGQIPTGGGTGVLPTRADELLDVDFAVTPRAELQSAVNVFGAEAPVIGLTRRTQMLNRVRSAVTGRGDVQERRAISRLIGAAKDEVIDPAFQNRDNIIRNARSRAVATVQRIGPAYRGLFKPFDDGTIPALAGVDPELPVAPTIQDVAARLPRYWDSLSPDQRQFLTQLRDELQPVADALRSAGDDFGTRADIVDEGFYLPRGSDILDPDAPVPAGTGGRPGSSPGFLRAATRPSMGEAIAEGAEYVPFEQALANGYIARAGRRIADLTTADFLKRARDADGTKFGKTAKELLLEQNPRLLEAVQNLRGRISRIQSLLGGKHEQLDRAAVSFLDDPAFTDIDALGNALERVDLISAIRVARREANELRPFAEAAQAAEPRIRSGRTVQRGRNRGQDITRLKQELRETRQLLRQIKPEYERQLRSVTRGRRPIGSDVLDFPQLNGITFPERMAARAEELLREERGGLAGGAETLNEVQNIAKGMQATLDDSGVGIQGLLSAFSRNPAASLQALRVNLKSFGTPGAYADWTQNFNTRARSRNLLTVEEWTDAGVRQLSPGEFDVTSTLPERVPIAGKAFRGANRAFATISNVIRAGWAEDLLMEEMAKGRTLQEIASDGTLQRIARHVNAATGVVDGEFHLFNLITFSARFLAARIATLYRAIRGVDINAPIDAIPVLGPRVARRVPQLNRAARLEDRLATRAIMRMIGFGTMATVALNEVQGRKTDFRPIVDGRYNSNFMRFRWNNRDWSLFGPWDSLARLFVSAGTGNVKATVRSVASAPGASLAIDLFENKDFFGRDIVDRDGPVPKQAADVLARFSELTVPFALDEAPELLEEIAENAGDGHLLPIGETMLTGVGEAFGVKSSPLSTVELQELLRQPGLPNETRQVIINELNERRSQRSSSASERLLPFISQTEAGPSRSDILRGLR